MDLDQASGPVDANLALSSEAPLQLHAKRTPEAKTQFHPEFFVVVTTSSSPDAQQQTVLPPPDPKPTDDTDWGFFWLGWVFGLLWVVGCFRPLCRQPRFPQKQNFRGWIGNVIGTMLLLSVIVVVTITALRQMKAGAAHADCTSDLSTRQLWACCRACRRTRSCNSICSRF